MKMHYNGDGEVTGVVTPVGLVHKDGLTLADTIKKNRTHCMCYPDCKGESRFVRFETNWTPDGEVDCIVRKCEFCGISWSMTKKDYYAPNSKTNRSERIN